MLDKWKLPVYYSYFNNSNEHGSCLQGRHGLVERGCHRRIHRILIQAEKEGFLEEAVFELGLAGLGEVGCPWELGGDIPG